MTQTIQHNPHTQSNPNRRNDRQTQLRNDADAILRDLAFVLKMTQRVRDEIDAKPQTEKPVSV